MTELGLGLELVAAAVAVVAAAEVGPAVAVK